MTVLATTHFPVESDQDEPDHRVGDRKVSAAGSQGVVNVNGEGGHGKELSAHRKTQPALTSVEPVEVHGCTNPGPPDRDEEKDEASHAGRRRVARQPPGEQEDPE